MILAVLLAAGATMALRAPFSYAHVRGFSGDGAMAIFEASIEAAKPEGEPVPWSEGVWVAIGEDGRPRHVARFIEVRAADASNDDLTPAAKALWAGAEDKDRGKALRDAVAGPAVDLPGASGDLKGARPASARIEHSGAKACPTERFLVSLAGREALAFEDACRKEDAQVAPVSVLSYAWNKDGSALAVAIIAQRGEQGHAYLGVLTAKNLAAVDLLVAGGTAEAAADKLAAAGFRVAHQAAAVKKRSDTAVYFAPGFKDEAEAVAQALGAPAAAVQPLSWKTPYAVTVALGSN